MEIFTVYELATHEYAPLGTFPIGNYTTRDEAVIKLMSLTSGAVCSSTLNCAYPIEEYLRCENVNDELIIYNEADKEICTVELEKQRFDNRLEDFHEKTFGYELFSLKIHGKDIFTSNLSDVLKRDINHQAENIIEKLNEELYQ